MTQIAHCRDATEAYLIKGGLAAEGIPAEVLDEHLVGINWLYSDAVGGVKVVVRPEDEERAATFLEEHRDAADKSVRRAPGGSRIAGLLALLAMSALAVPSLYVGIPFFAGRKQAGSD